MHCVHSLPPWPAGPLLPRVARIPVTCCTVSSLRAAECAQYSGGVDTTGWPKALRAIGARPEAVAGPLSQARPRHHPLSGPQPEHSFSGQSRAGWLRELTGAAVWTATRSSPLRRQADLRCSRWLPDQPGADCERHGTGPRPGQYWPATRLARGPRAPAPPGPVGGLPSSAPRRRP